MSTLTHMPRRQLLIAASAIIAVAMLFAHVLGVADDADTEGSVASFVGASVFGIAATAVLVLVAVPSVPGEHRRTAVLVAGGLALITIPVFWTALPFAFGAAALAAAGPGDERIPSEGEAPATAGVLLAALAIAGSFVLCIIG
jgi:hypothetical protein